jgi:hypothetical protein
MLGVSLAAAQKRIDIEIGDLAARWDIGFVPDEQAPRLGIADQKPPVSVRTTV